MTTEGPLGRFAAFMRNLASSSPSGSTPGATPRDLRKSLVIWGALVALTVLAGALRLYAVRHFSYTHPDEEIARAVVVSVLKNGDSDTDWARTDVAKQFNYTEYNFSSYYLFAADVQILLGKTKVDIKHQIGALRDNLRLLSAALGALCILFAGLLGWRVGGRLCGVATALLSACDVTLFQDSLYARPETFVTLLTLWFLLVLTSTRTHRGLVLTVAGFLLGVLIACKITFLIYFPFPLLLAPALLSTPKDGKPAEAHLFLWSGSLSAYFLAIGAGFALGAPYALHFPWEYVEGLVPLMKQYENGAWSNGLKDADMLARFANSTAYLVYTLGYPALLLALVGAARMLWRRDVRLLLILGGPLLTLLYFMQTRAFFERNFSQALPVLFLLGGLGIKALSDLIRKPALRRTGAAMVMLFGAAIAPALVTAKAIDPALDGRYQREVEAEATALSDGGRVPVFYGWHLNEVAETGRSFCGRYVIGLRDFREGTVPQGYTVVAYMHSVFGDYPVSTLQTYLSQPMIFVAPSPSASCALELGALLPQPGEAPLKAPLSRSSDWPTNPIPDTPTDSWPWPRYSSWGGSDKNTGTLTLGPFRACTDFVVPYAIGAARREVSLRITRGRAGAAQVLYDGIPLSAPDQWQQLTMHVPPGQCGDYTVTATDAGQGWQQWLGIGVPVVIGNRPATH
jgi:hypothetical protein